MIPPIRLDELVSRLERSFRDVGPPILRKEAYDSDESHCLELFTGKAWTSVDRETIYKGYDCLHQFDKTYCEYYFLSYIRTLLLDEFRGISDAPYTYLFFYLMGIESDGSAAKAWNMEQKATVASFLDLSADWLDDGLFNPGFPFEEQETSDFAHDLRRTADLWRREASP